MYFILHFCSKYFAMEVLIIFLLILLNGIFSMTEMALVSSKIFKLEKLKEEGKPGAQTALDLKNKPNTFLSTIQIGITLIGILLGVFSGDKIAWQVANFLKENNILIAYSDDIATFLVVLMVTFFSILLGELFPKRIGMTYPENIAMMFSRPMNFLSKITKPFVALLTASNRFLSRLFKIDMTNEDLITEEEIKSIIRESTDSGEIQPIEQEIVSRVFELGDRKIITLATYQSDIIYFNHDDDWSTVKNKINNNKHSAYPVCKDNDIDKIEGITLIKDLFADFNEEDFKVQDYMRDPLFIDENTYAYKVLEMFQERKLHYAIIIDEFGATQGIVTMDDVLDALVGESPESYHKEDNLVQRNDNSWIVDGKYPILSFSDYFNLKLNPTELNYSTLAGMLIEHNGGIPNVGDQFELGPYQYEILDKDGPRIDKVMVTKL